MKKLVCTCFLVTGVFVAALSTYAQEPGPALVEEGVAAYNNHDTTYFEQHLADDVVWLDEDGHIMNGKSTILGFIGILFNQTPTRTLTVSNVRIGNTSDAAWATYQYTLTGGEADIMGLNTTIFKRVGNAWQIAVVHGAFNAPGHH